MVDIKEKSNCTGCHACMYACPKSCIKMQEDEQGFKYPVVDTMKCVDCGLCDKVCHMKKEVDIPADMTAYASKNKNDEERNNSSSGGVFIVAAKWILDNGGSVYGAAFNENYDVEHIRVTQKDQLRKLQTSKYVQSIIGSTYEEAKRDLDEGRYVLYTGTPCQIGGLKAFLRKDYDNLYCQDIMCHGVPSPKVWQKYLRELDMGKINYVNFRDKTDGWMGFHVKIDGEKRNVYDVFNKNTYMRAFLSDASLRPSCYNCHYKHFHYAGDYTLADFWGISDACPEMNDDKGTSLLLINSEKGQELFNAIKDLLEVKQVDLNKAMGNNGAAINGASMNDKHGLLYGNIDKMTLHQIVEKYIRGSLFRRILNKLKR